MRRCIRGIAVLWALGVSGVVLWPAAGETVPVQAGLTGFAVVSLLDTLWPSLCRSLARGAGS